MNRWYNIMQYPTSSHNRYLSMINLVQDIFTSYPEPLMIIKKDAWVIEMLPFTSPIRQNEAFRSTSLLKTPEKYASSSKEDWHTRSAIQCQRDYQLFNHFSNHLNLLEKDEREIFIKKNIMQVSRHKIIDAAYISKRKYYELCKSAERKLIELCGLKLYDEDGILKNWNKYEKEIVEESENGSKKS